MQKKSRAEESRNEARIAELLRKFRVSPPRALTDSPHRDKLLPTFRRAAAEFLGPLDGAASAGALREATGRHMRSMQLELGAIPQFMTLADRGSVPLSCKPGCDLCCRKRVSAHAPEVLRIAHEIATKLEEPRVAEIRSRIAAHLEGNATMSAVEHVLQTRMCPLNFDGLCSIYSVRPLICTSYHSFDLEKCIADLANPKAGIPIPTDRRREVVRNLFVDARTQCLLALGWDARELEFIPALSIALTVPDTAERYIRGEDVFADAYRPDILAAR